MNQVKYNQALTDTDTGYAPRNYYWLFSSCLSTSLIVTAMLQISYCATKH